MLGKKCDICSKLKMKGTFIVNFETNIVHYSNVLIIAWNILTIVTIVVTFGFMDN